MALNAQMQQQLQQQPPASGLDMTALGAAIGEQVRNALGQGRSVVDSKAVGKPSPFSGEESKFRQFSQKFVAFMSGIWPMARKVMRWAEEQSDPIDDYDAEMEWITNSASEAETFTEVRPFSGQLHAALIGLVEGEGFDLVAGVEDGCGLEAWRKLTRRYDPQVAGRSKNMLKHVLNPPQCKAHEMLAGMEQWEQLCRRYTSRKGPDGRPRVIPDDILMGIVQEMGPMELKTHLYLNSSRFKSYIDMRTEIVSFLEAKVGARTAIGGASSSHSDPMDVGSFVKAGKSTPWAKAGKGKGKDKGKNKPPSQAPSSKQNPQKPKFDGECSNCGKYGHKWADCWAAGGGASSPPPKGAGKSKGKAKGKDKGKGKYGGKGGKSAFSVEEEPEQEGHATDTSALILALVRDAQGKVSWKPDGEEELEQVDMTLDSGSAVSACPDNLGKEFGTTGPYRDTWYTTADGNRGIQDKGRRLLHTRTEDCATCSLDMRVASVHKPLVAAGDVTHKGNIIVLSKHGSFVARDDIGSIHQAAVKATGNKPSFWLYKKKNVYTFPVWIDKARAKRGETDEQKPQSICPVEQGSTQQHQPQQRQVRFEETVTGSESTAMPQSTPLGFLRQAMQL